MTWIFSSLMFLAVSVAHGEAAKFTDTDFAELKKAKTTIVYTWSPHMVLSVRGLDQILTMKHPHRQTIVLLDPNANFELAKKIMAEHKWPSSVLKTFDSSKLREAGAGIHYPSYIVVSKRRPAGMILPGYKTAPQIESFIQGWKP